MTTRERRRLERAMQRLFRDLEVARTHGGRWIKATDAVTYLELFAVLDAAALATIAAVETRR